MVLPGFSRYDIHDDGIVVDTTTGRVLRPVISTLPSGHKYLRVCLKGDNGAIRMYNLMQLVALAFLPPPPDDDNDYVVQAFDGNKTNVNASNIYWISRRDLSKRTCRPRKRCVTEDSKSMVLDAMAQFDRPTNMTELSYTLQVPYSIIRYTIEDLVNEGKVCRVNDGFEVI